MELYGTDSDRFRGLARWVPGACMSAIGNMLNLFKTYCIFIQLPSCLIEIELESINSVGVETLRSADLKEGLQLVFYLIQKQVREGQEKLSEIALS